MQVRNYFVAAGMNSTGIASAGGFGRALAEWIADGELNILSLSLSLSLSSLPCPLASPSPKNYAYIIVM